MGLFKTLLEYPKGDRYVDVNEAYDLHREWERYVKKGKTKYCMVSIGSGDGGGDGWDDGDRGWWEEEDEGRDYYLAYQQWSAFAAWLKFRTPEEQNVVREFEVSTYFWGWQH